MGTKPVDWPSMTKYIQLFLGNFHEIMAWEEIILCPHFSNIVELQLWKDACANQHLCDFGGIHFLLTDNGVSMKFERSS